MDKENRRQSIIDAAVQRVCASGFEALSMAEIAEEAGVAKGTLYLYFTSKEQLLEAAFWQCHEDNANACDAGLSEVEGAINKLNHRLRNAVRWALENPDKSAFERLCLQTNRYGATFSYVKQPLHYRSVDKIIIEGLEADALRPLPSPVLGMMFFGVGGAVMNFLMENPDQLDAPDFWAQVEDSVRGCLAKE